MSKGGKVDSSFSERPGHYRPRRLADWLNPTGARKVHSLIDKVYKRKNLEIAWDRVRANQGAGGVDGESIEAFGEKLEERLTRLQDELRTGSYTPRPVRQQRIPKVGKPGEWRMLGIPTIYDRVCQQALLNRFSNRCSMTPTSDTGEGDRQRMPSARSGKRSKLAGSGSLMRT